MTMFLSRVQLNSRRRDARRLLSSAQRLHAAVLASFPDPPTGVGNGPRVLWRLDQEPQTTWLYVASPGRPDFSHVIDQAGWPASEQGWETKDYEPLLGKLDVGQRWRFRLAANPVHAVRLSANDANTARRAILAAGLREKWLLERVERCGFRLPSGTSESGQDLGPDLVMSAAEVVTFTKRDAKRPVTIARTQYDGLLEITDPEKLRAALVGGIGRAKGYGCGLLTLAGA